MQTFIKATTAKLHKGVPASLSKALKFPNSHVKLPISILTLIWLYTVITLILHIFDGANVSLILYSRKVWQGKSLSNLANHL